jgi:hypothetical protein
VGELADEILRYSRELRADPRSLRFVQLADALRRSGRFDEAHAALDQGLLEHPGHKGAGLVRARTLADAGATEAALGLLDELYPKDRGNFALSESYIELLTVSGRLLDARAALSDAELLGATREWLDRQRARIEEEEAFGISNLDELEAICSLPGGSLDEITDPFLTEDIVKRVIRSGSREAAARLWAELRGSMGASDASALRPRNLRHAPAALPPSPRPPPGPAAAAALRRLLRVIDARSPA